MILFERIYLLQIIVKESNKIQMNLSTSPKMRTNCGHNE